MKNYNPNNSKKSEEYKTLELNEPGGSISNENQLISIIAHDLRSPISSIISILDYVKKSLLDDDKDGFEKLLNIASESSQRTLNLLDTLLIWAISQSNGDTFEPEKVKCNLNQIIKSEIELYKDIASQKRITIHLSLAENMPISADFRMIATLIRNLIDNAIKYTKHEGKITIDANKNGKFYEIVIKDNGIGMSTKALQNFSSLNICNSDSYQNSGGLGLMLCKEIVRLHNGVINLESVYGKGSKFTIILPSIRRQK